MWFVAQFKGMHQLAQDTTKVANQMQLAAFPADMLAAVKEEVNPCDDFYEFACGTWDEQNKDKIDKFKTSVMLGWTKASDSNREDMTKIFEQDNGPAATYYKSCMDVDRIDAKGHTVMDPWLKAIDSVHDKDSLVKVITAFNKEGMDVLFEWGIDKDPRNGQQYAFELGQSDTSLPDKTYFLEQSEEMETHRKVFKEVVANMFRLIDRPEADKEAQMVFDLQKSLAEIQIDRVESRGDHGTPITWAEMEATTPWWPWRSWITDLSTCTPYVDGSAPYCKGDYEALRAVGTPEGKPLLLTNKGFFQKLQPLLEKMDIEQVKAEMRWKLISGSISSLGTKYLDTYFPLLKDLYGTQSRSPRPRKCYNSAVQSVPWPSAKLYYDKIFHQANQDAARSMLEEIRKEFRSALTQENWMDPQDREAAAAKLDSMFFQVGGPTDEQGKPDWPVQTTSLDGLLGPDMYQNDIIISRQSMDRALLKLTNVPKRRDWGSGNTPLEVNAFYGPDRNGLWIPAGILQAPFFDASLPDSRNFGSIGSILGHEMSHGFDDHGREFDQRGELKDWWHPDTVKGYQSRASCYKDVFDRFTVKGRHVNGALTLGEDLADAGGIKFAHRAFLAKAPRTEADERIFFTSFAQTWCSVERAKAVESQMLSDPHAPGKFRVIGAMTQFPAFAKAFHCPTGSPMAPPTDKVCNLW